MDPDPHQNFRDPQHSQERLHPSKKSNIRTSAVDPELLSPDPNPTFHVVPDPDLFKPGQLNNY
jgi:hypothetical protein